MLLKQFTKRIRPTLLVFASAAILGGCATPASDAYYKGDMTAVMELVRSKKVGVDDWLPMDMSEYTMTPLCIALARRVDPAIKELLDRGADVNRHCGSMERSYPLDIVIDRMGIAGSSTSPYSARNTSRPDLVPVYQGYARMLLQRGARSLKHGDVDMAKVGAIVNKDIEVSNAWHGGQQERLDKASAEQRETLSSLVGAAATVGGAVATARIASSGGSGSAAASNIASTLQATTAPVDSTGRSSGRAAGSGSSVASSAAAPSISRPTSGSQTQTWSTNQIKSTTSPQPRTEGLTRAGGNASSSRKTGAVGSEGDSQTAPGSSLRSTMSGQSGSGTTVAQASQSGRGATSKSGCMSYATLIPNNQHVCFANSMLQYACREWRGKEGLEFVQKLSLRSSLNECYHVDRTNSKPPVEQLLN